MKKSIIIISALILSSCGDSITIKKQEKVNESSVVANDESEAELNAALNEFNKEEEKRLQLEKESITLISFNEIEHDYGNVKPESDNTYFFLVTNTGKKPLIIETAEASCGCTIPEKPEKPILPGKTEKLKVVFHPKPGQIGEQNKTVSVTANTNPRISVLKIKAFVKE